MTWSNISAGGIICTCTPPPPGSWLRLLDADGTPFGPVVPLDDSANRVHVASNGAGFLAVTEDPLEVRATPIRVENEQIVLQPSQLVFRWINWVPAAVSFDGREYVIALRYSTWWQGGKAWLATARVRGDIVDRRVIEIAGDDISESPAIAADGSGSVLLAASQIPPEVGSRRVYTFLESEMEDSPPAPPKPANVIVTRDVCNTTNGCRVTLTWSGSPQDAAYLVEQHVQGPQPYVLSIAYVAAPERSFSLDPSTDVTSVHLRALGPGGISEPSDSAIVRDVTRRRAAGH